MEAIVIIILQLCDKSTISLNFFTYTNGIEIKLDYFIQVNFQ